MIWVMNVLFFVFIAGSLVYGLKQYGDLYSDRETRRR